jgi:hypothetical protein
VTRSAGMQLAEAAVAMRTIGTTENVSTSVAPTPALDLFVSGAEVFEDCPKRLSRIASSRSPGAGSDVR